MLNKSLLMRRAWSLLRQSMRPYSRELFGACLRRAWAEAKNAPVTPYATLQRYAMVRFGVGGAIRNSHQIAGSGIRPISTQGAAKAMGPSVSMGVSLPLAAAAQHRAHRRVRHKAPAAHDAAAGRCDALQR